MLLKWLKSIFWYLVWAIKQSILVFKLVLAFVKITTSSVAKKKPVDFDDELKIGDVRYDNMTKITIKQQTFLTFYHMKCNYAKKLTVYE